MEGKLCKAHGRGYQRRSWKVCEMTTEPDKGGRGSTLGMNQSKHNDTIKILQRNPVF